MTKGVAVIIGALLLLLLVLFSTTYSVSFHEVAIKTTFGQVSEDSIVTDAGLHFQLPFFADRVHKYDKRSQLLSSSFETVTTADDQQVVIQAFLIWRIDTDGDGPLEFFRGFESSGAARSKLEEQFTSALKTALGRYRFGDLVGGGSSLSEAEEAIRAELDAIKSPGIKPVAVGINHVMLPPKTTTAVLRRMEQSRKTLAEAVRHEGRAQYEKIRSVANQQAEKIRAFAEQRAAEIRAKGSEAAAEYLSQMSVNEDLAIFLVWLDTLEATLTRTTTFFLDTQNSPFHILNIGDVSSENPIPQPPAKRLYERAEASSDDRNDEAESGL